MILLIPLAGPGDPFEGIRSRMVTDQLKNKGISDPRVLEAFHKVPRHLFVPMEGQEEAYEDHPVQIGFGQTISQPYITACMTEQLRLSPTDRVLEIGTGSGFQTAILAELAGEVYTVELISDLSARARELLSHFGYKNIHYHVADGSLGWEEEAPFDRIVVTASVPSLPESLVRQLKDGGRMMIPVGEETRQDLLLVTREGGTIRKKTICGCVFVKLWGKEGW